MCYHSYCASPWLPCITIVTIHHHGYRWKEMCCASHARAWRTGTCTSVPQRTPPVPPGAPPSSTSRVRHSYVIKTVTDVKNTVVMWKKHKFSNMAILIFLPNYFIRKLSPFSFKFQNPFCKSSLQFLTLIGKKHICPVCSFTGRELPRIELYPEESVTIETGGSALFQCRVVGGSPTPTIVWSRWVQQVQH